MNMKSVAAAVAVVCLGAGTAVSSSVAASAIEAAQAQVAAKSAAPSVAARVVKGTMKTNRYLPKSYRYRLEVPTLKGVAPKVKKAFDKKIDALVARQLKHYSQGAMTKSQFREFHAGSPTPVTVEREWCAAQFKSLKAGFASAVYQDRYASVVLTFTGFNRPCGGVGGLTPAYLTDRSVTIDTQTGKVMKPTDFTSNKKGEVNAALKAWYATAEHEPVPGQFLPLPKVTKSIKVCDCPGNVRAMWDSQEKCVFWRTTPKTGLVSWMVSDSGLKLAFPDGRQGLRSVLLSWTKIPRLK